MAQTGNGDAGEEVEVLIAVGIDELASPPLGHGEARKLRDALQARRHVLRLGRNEGPRPRSGNRFGGRCSLGCSVHSLVVVLRACKWAAMWYAASPRQRA